MSCSEPLTITLETRGRVILPSPIRRALGWKAGARLIVEQRPDGVLLRPAPVFARTRPEQVTGCLAWQGAPKSLADMDAGVLAEARRRHRRHEWGRRPRSDRGGPLRENRGRGAHVRSAGSERQPVTGAPNYARVASRASAGATRMPSGVR